MVAASAGNHALGVAFAAQALGGIRATRVRARPRRRAAKVDKLRTFPVEVREAGATYDEAHARGPGGRARARAPPTSTPTTIPRTAAGQGTIALELIAQRPDLGHHRGPGRRRRASSRRSRSRARRSIPDVRIVAVQPEASPALRESVAPGRALLDYPAEPTLADGLAGGIGDIVFAHRAPHRRRRDW